MGSISAVRPEPRYTNRLRKLSLEDLFAIGEDVEALVAHPGWAHVMRILEAEVADVDSDLDGAREPLSQADYAMAHGRRGGLRGAQEAAGAILIRYRQELERQRERHERGAGSPQEALA